MEHKITIHCKKPAQNLCAPVISDHYSMAF